MHPLRSALPRPLLAASLFLTLVASLPLFAEDIVFSPPEEARAELFAMDLGDTDVSLFLSGSWKGTLSSSGGLALTEFGWTAASTEGPLLFAQESDLTLELIIRERWFVEASFLDDYALNTYRTGYRGTEGEAIQYLGLGNIGLDFPNFPYMNLGGDAPNSFGAYGKVVLSDYSFHALIRYDTAVREERVFVGNRERTMIDLAIENRLRGRAFTLPDQNLDASPQVFIEDSAGEYRASDGRKYRRARASEYSVSALRGLVELNSSPESRIAVTYTKNGDDEAWLSSLGSYLPSAGFLGEAQDAFTAHNDKIKLSEYPQPGEGDDFYNVTDRPATLDIAGYKALVIYEKGAFSPFEWGNRYASPAASGLGASASLVHLSNGTELSEFDLAPLNKNTDAGKSIFELQNLQYGPDPRSIHTRWPLLSENPEVYLSGLKGSGADLVLRFTSYGSASSLSIGTDVVASSVEVYRDGLLDSGAQFDVQSGSILLNRPPLASELIRVSYLKRSEERRFGSIAAGLGGIYDPEGPFSSRLALGLRWNINNEAFSQALPNSENRSANPGSVGLSASVAWYDETLKAGSSLGLRYEEADTTGLYRVSGMEGEELSIKLTEKESFPSKAPSSLSPPPTPALTADNRAPLVYRDYRSNDLVAGTTLKPITWTGSSLHSEKEGPYAVSDSQFTTEILVAEASLDAQKIWTGFQSKLGEEALGLEGAKRLLIPFKLNQISSTDDFKMYIQLGSLADEDGLRNDSMVLSYTAKIYDSSIDGPLSENWQIKALSLEDKDRRALASASSFRLIIQRDDPVPEDPELKFRVLVGPIKAEGSTFRPVRQEGAKLQSAEDTGSAGLAILETFDLALANTFESQIRRLHPDGETQRVLEIKWDQQDASMDINAIGFDGRKQPIPLSSYRSLGFYLRGPKADSLGEAAILSQARVHFSIGRNPDTLDLEAVIPLSSIQSDLWHFIEIRYQDEKEVYVDGERLGTASVQYRKKNVQESGGYNPTYILFLIEAAEGQILPAGSAAIDEITLSESISRYSANWGATLSWTNTGSLLKYQDISIISDPELNISVESDMSAPITGGESSGSLSSRLKGGGTLFKARLGGVLNVSIAPSGPLWSASHEVLVPIRSFSVQEAFSFDPDAEESSRKLDLKSTWPLGMDASAHLISKKLSLERGWDYAITIGGTREEEKQAPSFNVDASALWTEKGDTRLLGIQEYGPLWAATWERLVPDLGSIASKRNIKLNASTQTNTKPLGLEFLLAAQTAYVQQREATDNSASLSLGFPFVLSSLRGSFGLERSFSQNISGLSEDALSDYRSFATSMENGQNLMLSLPLYTLFDTYLDDSFDEASKGSNKSNFNDLIKIELSFQREAGLRALYLPSALRSSVARTLGRELDTHKETYVYNGSLDFSAINLFGAFGSRPLFNFYSSDELLQFWEAQVSLPRGEDPSWKLSSRLDAGFYGFTSAKLGFSNTLILEERRWSEAGRLEWAVPVQNSFLAALYDSTMQRLSLAQGFPALVELSQMEAERLRREGLEFSISGGESSNWALQLSHESLVRIVGHLTFSAFARLAISGDPKNERLSIASTIGTSLLIRY